MIDPPPPAEFLSDDPLLFDLSDDPNCNPITPIPEIFDAAIDQRPGLSVDQEEEELEWLANKDAFPPLETSFDPVSGPLFRPPARARSGGRRRRQKSLPTFVPSSSSSSTTETKKCRHCGAQETPQWRLGPEGPKTLCNACGVRYNSGRLVPEYRPANSPSFSPAIHSNSHRQVMLIRSRKYGGGRRGRPRVRQAYERQSESF